MSNQIAKFCKIFILSLIAIFILTIEPARAVSPKFLTLPFLDGNVKIQAGWIYDDGTTHYGIDYIKAINGRSFPWLEFNVRAAADGDAIYTENEPGWGNTVKIKHVQGLITYYTLYAHLDRSPLPVGQWRQVNRGDIIGVAGKTGSGSNGYLHLHFEFSEKLWGKGNQKDPYDLYMKRDNYPGGSQRKPFGANHVWTAEPPVFFRAFIPADINRYVNGICGDGYINVLDYTVLSDNFGEAPTDHPCADINDDFRVDILDYTILFSNWGASISDTVQAASSSAPLAVPNPPGNILFTTESNYFGTAFVVKMSWDDNSSDETGFKFTWDLEGNGNLSVTKINDTPPNPPAGMTEQDQSSSNTSSVLAVISCGEISSTRSVSASVSAFNGSGSSVAVQGTGTVEIPACPISGDANGDRKVDGFDYVIWWQHFGKTTENGHFDGDFSYDGYVDGIDYVIWWQNFGR